MGNFEMSFGLKYSFFKKKNYEISFEIKLLPKVVRLGHVGDSLANVVVLNSGFTIFSYSIVDVMDNDFTIIIIIICIRTFLHQNLFYIKTYLKIIETKIFTI